MFIQVVQGKIKDADLWRRELRRWRTELKPKAKGYVGTTSGVTSDGQGIALFRFESEKDARANSALVAQGKWWKGASKAFDGKVTIHNCTEVDLVNAGGSNFAGFVQVIQGRAKNQDTFRRRMKEMEPQLRSARPDVMGVTVAWHGDGSFTQAVYFTSAQAARAAEAAGADSEMDREFGELFDGPPTFLDLNAPDFD